MQIAVAQMPEDDIAHAREAPRRAPPCARARNCGIVRHRHADVVLDVRTLALLRLGNVLAQRPQRRGLRLRLRDARVGGDAVARSHRANADSSSPSRARLRRGVVGLHQHIPRVTGQRIGQCGKLRARERHAFARDELETGQAIAERLPRDRRAARWPPPTSASADPGRRAGARPRKQLQHRRGNDAERAFAAEEQLLQVVAGVVLAQALEAVPHAAVGEHDFESEYQVARVAVAQHRGAAGVGRQIAADGAAAFGRERQREHACRPRPPRPAPPRAACRLRRSWSRCRRRSRERGSCAP